MISIIIIESILILTMIFLKVQLLILILERMSLPNEAETELTSLDCTKYNNSKAFLFFLMNTAMIASTTAKARLYKSCLFSFL